MTFPAAWRPACLGLGGDCFVIHAAHQNGRRSPGGNGHGTLPLLLLLLPFGLTACATKVYDDPIAVMLDREAGFSDRRVAAAQAEADMPQDPRRLEALGKLLWRPRYLAWQRQYAIDQLLLYDPQFKEKLDRRIVLLRNWPTRQYVLDLAVERSWRDFTPAIVRAYAQSAHGMADATRPERAAIEALHPGRPVEQVIFDIFANASSGYDYTQQVAAWALLCRLSDDVTRSRYLDNAPADSPLVADLKVTGRALHVLPRNKEGVLWMIHLREPSQRDFWDAAAQRVATLDPSRRQGLELRHLGPLVKTDGRMLTRSRRDLLSSIERRLERADHVYKGPTFDAPLTDHPQRFAQWSEDLVWADLMTIQLVLDMLESDTVVRALFAQADGDAADSSTEYGGVLDRGDQGPVAQAYPPLTRAHNWKFIPSPDMFNHLYTAVAHYHFHAQTYRNGKHAGPGRGDMRMADAVRATCLVFTCITQDRMNVDYYQPGKVVVDLGSITRR